MPRPLDPDPRASDLGMTPVLIILGSRTQKPSRYNKTTHWMRLPNTSKRFDSMFTRLDKTTAAETVPHSPPAWWFRVWARARYS